MAEISTETASLSLDAYSIHERIAVGGMAELFLASKEDPHGARREVIIKRMLPRLAKERGAREMFEEEARLGRRIVHENVVEVLNIGTTADGQPYLVLEYVPGCDLWRLQRWLMRSGQKLSLAVAIYVVRQLLAGLDAVHSATEENGVMLEIVHRDVSPSNVMLSVHGHAKIGDFGIARTKLREHFPIATLDDHAKGKLGYLSPEQVAGGSLDQRADIFAAGVIMAELLIGTALFSGGSELAVLLAIRDADVQKLVQHQHLLPTGMFEVLTQALAQNPADRFASANEFASALEAFQERPDAEVQLELGRLIAQASDRKTSQMPEATPIMQVTAEFDTSQYEVRTHRGERFGPWTFAVLIEAIATGKIALDDQISENGEPFRPISMTPHLKRHLPLRNLTPITEERATMPPIDELSFAEDGIIVALTRSATEQNTGMWLCQSSTARKEIYVQDGVPRFVTSNLASELLGEYLIRQKIIARGELDMALAVMPRFDGRLGDTLVGLGLVDPIILFQHIAEQVRQRLLDLFLWRNGSLSFFPGVEPPPSGFPLALDPWRILIAGRAAQIQESLCDSPQETEHVLANSALDASRMPNEIRTLLERTQARSSVLRIERVMKREFKRSESESRALVSLLSTLGYLDFVQ